MDATVKVATINFLHLIPTVIILVGCIIYLERRKSVDGVLMLIAKIGAVFLGLLGIAVHVLVNTGNVEGRLVWYIYKVMTPLSILASLLFAIGFLIMAMRSGRAE